MKPFFALMFLLIYVEASAVYDSQLLLKFKASLANPSVLQSWVLNSDPCSFNGVKCQNSRVSSIQLSYISLSTDFLSVASFILPLENLKSLSLLKTNISGNISFPSGSKCSSSLNTLDLSENVLSGPLSTVSNFGVCSNLKVLNLSSNNLEFSGEESKGLQLSLEVLGFSTVVAVI